jgi:uncharacterized protein YabE (DUF348 family)
MRPWARTSDSSNVRDRKRHLSLLLLTFAVFSLLAASCAVVARMGSHAVTVTAWDRQVSLVTSARTVQEVLAEANIILGANDYCKPAPDTALIQGMNVEVVRASLVFIHNGGKVQAVETSRNTVGEVLSQASIAVGADDSVMPGITETLPDTREIRVVRVTYADIVEEEAIPFTIEQRDDSSLEAGFVRVYKNGVEGLAEVAFRVKYEDGVEVSRQEISRKTVREPASQVLLRGTLQEVSRGGIDIRFERALEMRSTAYCPCTKCCGPTARGVTSSGLAAEKGVVAVDPRVIPMGSKLYVDGYGYAVAADTGSAIKGNRLDVCFATHEEALAWGMRTVKVYVIE